MLNALFIIVVLAANLIVSIGGLLETGKDARDSRQADGISLKTNR